MSAHVSRAPLERRAPDSALCLHSSARLLRLPSAGNVQDPGAPGHCAQWERQTAPQLIKEFVETGKVRLAFVNYPLRQHQNALPAADAAMCAGAQGKFWEMHDQIFKTQEQWSALPTSEAFFAGLARQLALDLEAYNSCIGARTMRPMIEADVQRATNGGANSTPTFFIGNQVMAGAEPIQAFRDAIAKATAALPK